MRGWGGGGTCVRACVRACACVCVRAFERAYTCVYVREEESVTEGACGRARARARVCVRARTPSSELTQVKKSAVNTSSSPHPPLFIPLNESRLAVNPFPP